MSKRGKDTEWDASRGMEEKHEFCFKDFAAVCLFWNFFVSGFPVILLITPKRDMLIAAVPFLWGVPYTGIKKEYKNGLRRMETLTIVESGGLACYHWKMFHITIRSKTGGTDHGCEYDRTVRAGSAGAP